MKVEVSIEHIKKNMNEDNLKAYICHKLSLKSAQHSGNVISKKRSATERFQDWIQYDKYTCPFFQRLFKPIQNLFFLSKTYLANLGHNRFRITCPNLTRISQFHLG